MYLNIFLHNLHLRLTHNQFQNQNHKQLYEIVIMMVIQTLTITAHLNMQGQMVVVHLILIVTMTEFMMNVIDAQMNMEKMVMVVL